MTSDLQGLGLPWYTEAEWLRAKTVMEDGHTFHATYGEFVARIEKVQSELRRQGHASIRIHLRMDEFVPWCQAGGRKIDSQARAEFAAWKARKADGCDT